MKGDHSAFQSTMEIRQSENPERGAPNLAWLHKNLMPDWKSQSSHSHPTFLPSNEPGKLGRTLLLKPLDVSGDLSCGSFSL